MTKKTARQRLKEDLELALQIELRESPINYKKISELKKQLDLIERKSGR